MTTVKKDSTEQNENIASEHTPSRREFLCITAGGAAAAALVACSGGSGTGDGDSEMSDESDPVGDSERDTADVGPAPENRVVRIINSNATTWDGEDSTDFYQYAVQDEVDAMVERGILELTGESDITTAWQSLIPYADGELVVIHINAYANNQNDCKNNVAAPVSAVIHGLVDIAGIPADRIAVTDPSRTLAGSPAQARIIDGCRYADAVLWDLYTGEYGSTIPFTNGHGPSVEERLARSIEEADHVIMMPVLSWHGGNWLTGAMKMMMGSIRDMGGLHQTATSMNDGAALADICAVFKDKVRLLAADGLFGNIRGNSDPPHAFQTLGGQGGTKPSSTLYFTKDMVALDSVMYDDLLAEARAAGSPKSGYSNRFLGFAADAGHRLGTFEMLDDTGADSYSEIDFRSISLS